MLSSPCAVKPRGPELEQSAGAGPVLSVTVLFVLLLFFRDEN